MPQLSFDLNFRSREMNDMDLPLDVRQSNSALVTRTRSSQTITLEAGTYFVTARLPAGQEITRAVELGQSHARLPLSPDPEDEWDYEWDEERHFLDRVQGPRRQPHAARVALDVQVAPTSETSASMSAPSAERAPLAPPRLRVFSGNLLLGEANPQSPTSMLRLDHSERGRVVYLAVLTSTPILVQILEGDTTPFNLIVPPSARIAVSRRAGQDNDPSSAAGLFKIEAFTQNPNANLILRYNRVGSFQRATNAAESERLLSEKVDDPIAAAIGAYSLLRTGDLEKLHDWTQNLYRWFPDLPDGAAIFGEHLARLGRHAEALEAFTNLLLRGMPIVADGLFYTFERVKAYAQLAPFRAAGLDVDRAASVVAALSPFAGWVHRRRSLTSFPGLDPLRPDVRRLAVNEPLSQTLSLDLLAPFDPTTLPPSSAAAAG